MRSIATFVLSVVVPLIIIALVLRDVTRENTLGAYVMLAFVLVHVYLITTGHTLTSNLKAMITGWEEIVEEGNEIGDTPIKP